MLKSDRILIGTMLATWGVLIAWKKNSNEIAENIEKGRDSLYVVAEKMVENNTITQDSAGVPVKRLVMDATTLGQYKNTIKMAKLKTWQLENRGANENDKPEIK